ncbi:MAG: hypothetical protein FWD87_04035 [Spirochaetaceae bacterium]|nr:hypothetical protein [Spirochaetaceae bacterium]
MFENRVNSMSDSASNFVQGDSESQEKEKTEVIIRVLPQDSNTFHNLLWKSVKVKKSLDEICHSVELKLPFSERNKIKRHDKIEVRVFNKNYTASNKRPRLTTVFIDEITDLATAKERSLVVIGRSPARDIIDSTWTETLLGSTSFEKIVRNIGEKFNIPLALFPRNLETQPVFSFSWDSESPWTKLLAEADNQGLIFTSNEAGALCLWKVAGEKRSEGFFLGLEENENKIKNVRSVQTVENGAGQFNTYVVIGGANKAIEIDDTCKNNRVLTINLTDLIVFPETLKRRAKTELRRRQEIRTIVSVSGWGLDDYQLQKLGCTEEKEVFWNPNFLIPVKIPSSNLNGNYLISQVEYNADPSTFSCDITLVKREAYL